MIRNDVLPKGKSPLTAYDTLCCSNCGGSLEPVENRFFLMYKRARLPQPRADAFICQHCGWIEGDDKFKALLQARLSHK